MPLYEFTCQNCKREFEKFHISYAVLSKKEIHCPKCESENVKKKFSPIQVDPDGVYLMNEKQKREYWTASAERGVND